MDALYELHVQLEPETLTIKWHSFYKHVLEHEQEFGPLYMARRDCALLMDNLEWALSSEKKKDFCNSRKTTRESCPEVRHSSNVIQREQLTAHHRALLRQLLLPDNCTLRKRGSYMESSFTSLTPLRNVHLLDGPRETPRYFDGGGRGFQIEHRDEAPRLGTSSQLIRDSPNSFPAITAEYPGEQMPRGVYGYGPHPHFDRRDQYSSILSHSEKTPISVMLSSCLENGLFNVEKAGRIVHEAYRTRTPKVKEEIESFLAKNAYKFTGPMIIGEPDLMNPDWHQIMTCGQQLLNHFICAQHQKVINLSAKNCEEFRDVGGAVYNVTGIFHYPREPPFSGEQISLLGINPSNQSAHIRLKSMLFHVLSRSCTQQCDIQSVTWILPNEKNSKGPNRRDFPDDLTALKQALVELRHGTFLPPVIGQKYGRFVYRKRHTTTPSTSFSHQLMPYQLTAQETEDTERQEFHDTNVAVLTEAPTSVDDSDKLGETIISKEASLPKKNNGKNSGRRRHNSQKDKEEEETDGQAAPAKRANIRRTRRNI
ncbi:unnamed protein product [Caenorhabditis sp. 36 PRJEB53466]|nr:unnamed protein product [Caenorhabditis sp. 36 PRJEB53466]